MTASLEPSSVMDVVFWVISGAAIAGAAMVVLVRDVFRAAVFLAATFLAVAGLYFLLSAEFVGVVQILVYVGAVSVLFVFAVMMVHDLSASTRPNRMHRAAATAGALMAVAVIFVAFRADWTESRELSDADALAGLAGAYVETRVERAGGSVGMIVAAPLGTADVQQGALVNSTGWLGGLLIREFVLPFEALGVLLVAALIGALVLVRGGREQLE